MDLVTGIDEIQRLAEEREEENYRFRAFLKGYLDWSERRFDRVVHEIARMVMAEIDCTACTNCCRAMGTGLDSKEIVRFARHLGISPSEFERCYVTEVGLEGKAIARAPCPFLDGCLCSIYEDRPKDCQEFPHLLKKDMLSRSLGLIQNSFNCPIVFNTLELLKRRLGWRDCRR